MNDEEFDFIQGQMTAINLAMSQLILVLPRLSAAQAALGLAVSQEEEKLMDEENENPAALIRGRDSLLGAYIELLQNVSSSD